MKKTEFNLHWRDHQVDDQKGIIAAHAIGLKADPDRLTRLFQLGNPMCVMAEDRSYCRIAEESVEVMKVIFRNYLHGIEDDLAEQIQKDLEN